LVAENTHDAVEVMLNAGKIQKNLETDEDFKTPLQQKLDEFGQQLSKVSLNL